MLWTSDVVKDPWFPLVKDPSGSMSSYHLSRFTRRCNDRCATAPSCRDYRSWAGPSAATCGSTPVGPPAIPAAFAALLQKWSRLLPT